MREMIKIKKEEIRTVVAGLADISTRPLPVKTSYWIAKLAKKMEKKVKDLEIDRMILLGVHGKRDENNQLIINDGHYMMTDKEAFDKEFKALTDEEIEVEFNKIPLSLFGNASVTPASLIALEKFIDEEK